MKRSQLAPVGLLVLRVVVGGSFFYHGLTKYPMSADAAVSMFTMWGMPAPSLTVILAILLELVGGALLAAGVATTPVALVLAAEMVVAMFKVHWTAGFSFMQITGMDDGRLRFGLPGWEVNLLYIAAFICLALAGPGGLPSRDAE